jgi:alkylhydroperoxidase family enzyme
MRYRISGLPVLLMQLLLTISVVSLNGVNAADERMTVTGWPVPPSDAECWRKMPTTVDGKTPALPSWIRMVAKEMPKTAAAFLELDLAQRTAGPVEPKLRAAIRWAAAKANGCQYTMSIAAADALRAGVSQEQWTSLTDGDRSLWSDREKAAIQFATDMTLDSDGVTDKQFADLVVMFDERTVAAMVLHMAYANLQDRLILCLGVELEEGKPLAPLEVHFSADSLVQKTLAPPPNPPREIGNPDATPTDIIQEKDSFTWLPYEALQTRLLSQKTRKTRLRVPDWQEFADKLPKGLMPAASDIVWYKVAFGYAQELAIPYEIYMRTAGSEIAVNWDRPFGNCLFWMVTDAIKCPYCMGHCEMNWEVAGFDRQKIADISQKLAGNDWSSFSAAEQKALDFARKLTRTPSLISKSDIDSLRQGFGDQRAFFIMVNTSRYNYMTRISNGFQLTLETGNPFYQYYNMPVPQTPDVANSPRPTPIRRDDMKKLLESMKNRRERVMLPPVTEEEKSQTDPRATSYESRLSKFFLPSTSGARGYLNFSGSPARTNRPTDNRPVQEPDPNLTLDYGFKTRLFWIASRVNNCQYCLGHQESKLLAVGMTDDQIANLDLDWSKFPENEQAAFALARRLTLEPQLLSDVDIDVCRKYYSDVQILEMVLSVAGNNAINRWKEGVGVPQSRTGGSFGGSNTEEHSYLTDTNPLLASKPSSILEGKWNDESPKLVPTERRIAKFSHLLSIEKGLSMVSSRASRLPMKSDQETKAAFSDLDLADDVPNWIRVLANFPIAGKRQVIAFQSAEKDLDLSALTRARLAWLIARQNGALYSLAEADARLRTLGQSREQINELDRFEESTNEELFTARDKALLTVARNLAASPVVLTDSEAQRAIDLAGPREFVQTVHYTAMRSLFDRFTEACGLPAD